MPARIEIGVATAADLVLLTVASGASSSVVCVRLLTPNLDHLAQRGTFFTNFHVSPVCSVTRSMLLTGNDPIEVGLSAFDYTLYHACGDGALPWNGRFLVVRCIPEVHGGSGACSRAEFMLGLAAGRLLSFILDGMPHWLLIIDAALEIVLGLIAITLYRGHNSKDMPASQ